jgi:hypothetical protein
MSGGGGWIDRIIGWCFGAFTASILLYCTVHLLQSMLPALIVVGGIVGLLTLVIGSIVVIRTWRNRW